jgi:predicted phosphoribosyltransferase
MIGHPANREYAIGAVSLTDAFVIPHRGVPQSYIDQEIKTIRERLKQMYRKFMGGKEPESLTGKTVIVIDDGIATGNTLLGTINMLRKNNPAKIVIAAPVASDEAVRKLSEVADELIVVLIPEEFYGVGAFYENFGQVTDEEVMYYLDKWRRETKKAG